MVYAGLKFNDLSMIYFLRRQTCCSGRRDWRNKSNYGGVFYGYKIKIIRGRMRLGIA